MPQLVGQHHKGHLVERAHGIEIINGTAAVGGAVGHDDDMVARGIAYGIVQPEKLHRHQVAVGTEGVVRRTHQAVHLNPLARVGDARFLSRKGHSPHIEIVPAAAEGLLSQQVVAKRAEIAPHLQAVGRAIAFRHYDHINLFVRVALVLKPLRLRRYA